MEYSISFSLYTALQKVVKLRE